MNQDPERKTRRGLVIHQSNPFVYPEMVETSTKFVKLYPDGVRALRRMNSAGTKVFELLWFEARDNMGKDEIFLSFSRVNQEVTPIGKSTFMRGMAELIASGFLAPTLVQGWYWLNPYYIWNGDRRAFLKKHDQAPTLPSTPTEEG